MIQYLSPYFFCLAIDLPGHGNSLHRENGFTFADTAEAISRVLEENRITSSPIVGYSLGGRIALYLAVHYRHLCSALIVESATAGIRGEKFRTQRRILDDRWICLMKEEGFEEFLRTWYSQSVFSSLARKPALLETLIKRRRCNDAENLARALKGFSAGAQPPLWDRLPSLALPVLLITGAKDEKYVALMTDMARVIPGAALVIHPEGGHNVHLEHPEDFAEHIIAFLEKQKFS